MICSQLSCKETVFMFTLVARASCATQFLVVPVSRTCELKRARAHLSQRSCLICAHCGCLSMHWCIYLEIFETHAICSQLSCKDTVFMFPLVAHASRATQLLVVPVSRACKLERARAHLSQRSHLICAHCVCSSVRCCI